MDNKNNNQKMTHDFDFSAALAGYRKNRGLKNLWPGISAWYLRFVTANYRNDKKIMKIITYKLI